MRISDWSSDVCSSDLALPWRVFAATEFLEDRHLLSGRNAHAGIVHLDPQQSLLAAHTQQHATAWRVSHRVGEEVLQHPTQQLRVAAHPGVAGDVLERQATIGSERAELGSQRIEHFGHGEHARFRRSEEHTSELQSLMRTSY